MLVSKALNWASWRWYPRQESNLRTRLRRPVLYPLSYGGSSLGHLIDAAAADARDVPPVRALDVGCATAVLDRLRDVLRGDVVRLGEIRDSPRDLQDAVEVIRAPARGGSDAGLVRLR